MEKSDQRSQVDLIQKSYNLCVNWHAQCAQLPKAERFSVGQKIEGLLIEMLSHFGFAYYTSNTIVKLENLKSCDSILMQIKIMTRLAKDIKAIDQKKYIAYTEILNEIGRMLGGWMASISKKNG
jgi:hypothetical protein